MEEDKKKLATIEIDALLAKTQVNLTWVGTEYRYVNMTLVFLEEYDDEAFIQDKQEAMLTINNIEISQTKLNEINKGCIFEITLANAVDEAYFNDFAVKYEAVYTPYSEDKFLLANKNSIKIINHPIILNYIQNERTKTLNSKSLPSSYLEELSTVAYLSPAIEFLHDLKRNLNTKDLYYDIYDVDGFLSILTDDKKFEFYIDVGDLSKKFKPKSKNVFGVFISHLHCDHYNILLENGIKAEYYILPYGGSILYNGKQLYPADEIRILSRYKDNAQLVLKACPAQKGRRNRLISFKIAERATLYFPMNKSPNNKNLESLCISFDEQKVFYPGDTMHYMYQPYIRNFEYFIASHHGGDVGKLNLSTTNIKEIIINTHSKNYVSKVYLDNLKTYQSSCLNLMVSNYNSGLKFKRIKL